MELVNNIKLDMVQKGNAPVVYAVQNELYTRVVSAELFVNGFPFDATGLVASVAYHKPDGTSGWYDTLPDGNVAYNLSGNNVSVRIAPQMLTVAGSVNVAIRIETTDGSRRAVTFPFLIDVAKDPAENGNKSENYYSVQNWGDVDAAIKDLYQLVGSGGGGGGGGSVGGSTIDDNNVSEKTTWSSAKINGIIGDIETALDAILAIQNELIGGDGV